MLAGSNTATTGPVLAKKFIEILNFIETLKNIDYSINTFLVDIIELQGSLVLTFL
jgi:hypothetical protein